MDLPPASDRRPRFTLVCAAWGVAPYLPAFIESVERQRFDLRRVEVIAVDDGSTDGSRAILEDWARRRPSLVRLISQANAGLAAAQNRGLDEATGEWVTFADPDDVLDPGFLAAIDRFLVRHPDVHVATGRSLYLREAEGSVVDGHPRRSQFVPGTRVVDLAVEPSVFPGNTNMAFYPLDAIRAAGLRFDTRVRPKFEDGHFTARYLLGVGAPRVGLVAEARYLYRVRASGTSLLQATHADRRHYEDVLEFGYLDLLHRARAEHGDVPEWLAQLIVYELAWYLAEDDRTTSRVRIPESSVDRFHELFAEILAFIPPEIVARHASMRLRPVWADILAHAARPGAWHATVAVRTKVDPVMRLQRIAHRYTGSPPTVEYRIDGRPVEPAFAKTQRHAYYRRTLIRDRVAWLPLDGRLEVRIDGHRVDVVDGWPAPALRRPSRAAGGRLAHLRRTPPGALAAAVGRRLRKRAARVAAALVRWLARSGPVRARYGRAWVVLDRTYETGDNAERLYEHLHAARPDINAWFVLARGTADWERMRRAGVPRMVAYGSLRWRLLMLNCAWIVSSHADVITVNPPEIMSLVARPTWRFAFLQHGVIKDDLSVWLNQRDIDLFVVSTPAERDSIVGDDTGYDVTAKEVVLTGLPRWDRLRRLAAETPADARDLIVLAPTWRKTLTIEKTSAERGRPLQPTVLDSDYVRSWTALLRSPEIAEAAARHGRRLAFMPHPNMQALVPLLDLPPGIETPAFAGADVQQVYARMALMVTDYSSVSFDASCIDVPVVYFQFDRDVVMAGGHLGRQGYFDYRRDGFGPVADTIEEAVAAIVRAIEQGSRPEPEYQARIDQAFTTRDGHACERVVAAIEAMGRPYRAVPAESHLDPVGAR